MTRPTYVIAEAGVNHNGSLDRALELVDAAARCGADAVKFQSFTAETLVSARAAKASYQQEDTGSDGGQLEMLRQLQLGLQEHRTLLARSRERGIEFLSTPFDEANLEMLVTDLGVARLKIGSGDLTHGPLLLRAGDTGLPVILSTGMASLEEIDEAVGVLAFCWSSARGSARPCREAFLSALQSDVAMATLRERLVLLQCTTEYPAPFDEVNLRSMTDLRERYGVPVGFSDHTEGIAAPLAAVALGAAVIEKHFTLDRSLPGPDHRASLEPDELAAMITGIRRVELALGSTGKPLGAAEGRNRLAARRSLVATCPIARGELFSAQNLGFKRPADGLSPMSYWDLLGRPAPRDFAADEAVSL